MAQRRTPPLQPARRSGLAWALLLGVTVLGLTLDLVSKALVFQHLNNETVVDARDEPPLSVEQPPEAGGDHVKRPRAAMPSSDTLEVLPWGLLDFRLARNTGAVFGLGAGQRGLLIAFTMIAVCIALWIFGWRTAARSRMVHVGIALVLAGALGNLWDRIVFGHVRDFMYMLPGWNLPFGLAWPGGDTAIWPWIFNVADVLLLAGLGLIFIHMYRADKRESRQSKVESR